MIKRIVDISEESYLHLEHRQLLIKQNGKLKGRIPVEDIGVLILQHPAIVLTQKLIIACQKNNTVIVFCDEKHLPYSSILPIAKAHTLHTKVLKLQINITEPTRKNIWKNIVQIKIREQAKTLKLIGKDESRLLIISNKVKSGDSGNSEAVAAKVYWKILFGKEFRRNSNVNGINTLLNYGYSIIRAMVARSICGAGLHPSIGIFHHNQYNALCLADDLMEPFRPWVDYLVYGLIQNNVPQINHSTKQELLSLLSKTVLYDKKKMPLMVCIPYLLSNLKRCFNKENSHLTYPVMLM